MGSYNTKARGRKSRMQKKKGVKYYKNREPVIKLVEKMNTDQQNRRGGKEPEDRKKWNFPMGSVTKKEGGGEGNKRSLKKGGDVWRGGGGKRGGRKMGGGKKTNGNPKRSQGGGTN